ncbi:MAG: alpha-amylase, partial [Deltaproteobacteria bacterium]|nr:alpha-amylase [Deltaproteobacteria bacterium]
KMTLAKLHFQRLWYPQPGQGGGVPSRAERGLTREEFDRAFPTEFWREVVDRVAAEAPGTLLLAEAFWLMEGYFVRTLGMHRVYNSAFMNMLKMEDNARYRQTIKNVLEFNPEILKRFVNFMNNPDERTAVEQFGKEGKYVGAAVLLVTMPGLPMFGHGQIEGFHEKYGMEYHRAYWDEPVDEGLVAAHEDLVFPLMRKRYLFSGSENFALYDFWAGDRVNEDVFAYSNRAGGERAVIVYHNRCASTAGWIRTSAAFAVKDGAGGTRLEQTTLAHALSLDARPGRFYAFRDWATGLEYLRSGRDLADHGLYAELGAFQHQALLDWRELWDADGTTWGRLCDRLGGRGVRSLDTELKEVRFADVVRGLTELLASARGRLDDLFDPASPGTRETAAAFVLDRFGALAEAVAAEGRGGPIGVAAIREAFRRELAAAGKAPPPDEHGRMALVCFLALRRLGAVGGMDGSVPRTAAWLEDFGILRAAMRFLGGVPAAVGGAGVPDGLLLRLLVARPGFVAEAKADAAGAVRAVFSDPIVREAVGLHWSGGHEWFNKERFEDAVAWLARIAAIDAKPGAAAGLRRTAEALVAAAEAAGWRADRLVPALAASKPPPAAPGRRKPS